MSEKMNKNESWRHVKLGEHVKVQGGFAFNSLCFVDEGIPLIRISNVTNLGIQGPFAYLPNNFLSEFNDFEGKDKNILIAMSGATTGKLARVKMTDLPCLINQRVGRYVLKNETYIDEEYLYYVVNSYNYQNEITIDAVGGAQPNVSSKELESITIPITSLSNQRRIASILSTIDEAIEQTETLIKKTQQIKAGLMHDLFTRGVLPNGHLRPPREEAPELYKDSRTPLGWVPKEWEVEETENKIVVIDPQPDHRTPPEVIDGYPYIGIGDIDSKGNIDFKNARKISKEAFIKQKESFEIYPGSFIFGKIGTIGQAKRISSLRYFALSANVLLLTSKEVDDLDYGYWLYNSTIIERQITDITNTTSQPALGIQKIRKILLPWPLREEEKNNIVKILENIDMEIIAEIKICNKLKESKYGLMHDLLNGRVPVTVEKE